MLSRRNVLTTVSLMMTTLVLFQFQNCGSAASVANSAPSSGGEMRIVDELNKAELQFVSQSVEIHDQAAVANLSGLCARTHNGAGLRWSIWAGSAIGGTPLLSGISACARGQFGVLVEAMDDLVCGIDHLLVVEGDWGGSTFTRVVKRCQPLVSEVAAAPEGSPFGTQCELEYQPASEAGDACTQVCYRDQKVVSSRALPENQCSGLAARLAGP